MNDHTPPPGVHIPLITPFTAEGEVAAGELETLAHEAIDGGAAGLVALGTTAESPTLAPEEKTMVADVCARVCRERGSPLTIGAGGNDTRRTVEDIAALRRWPEAAAALVPVPPYTRPAEAGVVAHFAHVAEHTHLPLIVYNIPYRTGQRISAETLLRLAEIEGVAGLKHAVGGIDADTVDLLGRLPSGFSVFGGDDLFISPLLAIGGCGGVLASAHLHTGRFAELVDAWRDRDSSRARELGHHLAALSRALFSEPSPAVLKGVLHAQGRISTPAVRLPLLEARADTVAAAVERFTAIADG
ncbi:MAG: 4-hydroxy-tetrahydrodipicolinate synthase [Nocardiopsaceae bacterium]|nr:4-hydroxy-tetrahydrodipicolinate synthase [Nocardiopsaceae bacterium]